MSKRAEWGKGIVAALALVLLCGGFLAVPEAEAAPSDPRILVLPFQVHADSDQSALEAGLPDLLASKIGASGLQVVPREQMARLMQARKITTLDVATVRSLAQAAGATHAVYGSVNQIGSVQSVDARLVSASAAQQPQPIFVERGAGDANLQAALDDIAATVVAAMPRPSAPDAGGNVIAGVEIRGTKVLDPDVVLMRISSRKGDRPDAASIDQEIKMIWDLGYFSDVSANIEQRPDGMYLVYTVMEKPKVEIIDIQGASELDADDVLAVMSTKAGSVLNESMLADDIQKILGEYRKKGFYLAKVDQRVDMRGGGASAGLTILIDEGKKLYIKEVRIEGVNNLDEGEIKDQLLLSERTLISFFTGTGVLKEELIERDSSAITAFYLDRGYMDITVAAPRIDFEEDGIVITFPIHEGPCYTLGSVYLTGDLIDADERLREVITTDQLAEQGAPFNLTAMQNDSKNLSDFYADYGYAFADIDSRPQKHQDGSNVVDVNFVIQKKNKVYVRRVLVEGNSKTRDNVILREMRLTDGEEFEGNKLRRSTERLNKLGYFEVAEAELVPTERDDEVDLKVKVKERPTGALMAGVGYSTFSQFGVSGTIMERNLWGKGYHIALQAAFSGRRDAYTLTFGNPRLNDTPLSVSVDAYHWRDDYYDYIKKTTGGVIRFAYPIGEYTSVGWGYRLDQYEIYDLDWDVSDLIRRYADETRYTSVALARITRDTTDSIMPTKGNIDSIGVEYGGGLLGGDDDFITLTAEHHSYYSLKPGHTLHGRVKGQAIFENGDDEVPVFERFWMGGMNSIRGYSSRDITPRDPKSGDRIGGTRMAFMNLEYIWTMSEEFGLYLVPFYDMGFNIDADRDYTFSDELLKSAGLEVRWRSPLGDLRFSYGVPFDEDRKGNRNSGRFEFAMGNTF